MDPSSPYPPPLRAGEDEFEARDMRRPLGPPTPDLVAYVGEDELGGGTVGLKQARVPAGVVPLVAVLGHRDRLDRPAVVEQLQQQADAYGRQIRLVRYVPVEVLLTIEPHR